MKLGEALTLRSQLQTRIEQLRGRLRASALVQEGEQPPEDPASLLAEFDDLATQLERLVTQINHTNLATKLPDGTTRQLPKLHPAWRHGRAPGVRIPHLTAQRPALRTPAQRIAHRDYRVQSPSRR